MSQVLQNECANYFPTAPLDVNKLSLNLPVKNIAGVWDAPRKPKNLDEKSILLAVIAHIRHAETNYDELLMQGMDRSSARDEVREEIDQLVAQWIAG